MNKYAKNHVPAKLYEFRGRMMTTSQIAKVLGVTFSCVSRRLIAKTPLDRPSQNPTRTRYE